MTDMWEQLKQNSQNALSDAQQASQKHASSGGKDERMWSLTRDKAGNGSAVIRFLPPPQGENEFMVQTIKHFFPANEGGGKGNAYFVENCPSMYTDSNDYDCPVCEANNEIWDDSANAANKIPRRRSRQFNFISNILVVNDPANSENNGKVFLFQYGKKIKGKIDGCLAPQYAGEVAYNPTDLFNGADFNLKSKKVDKQINYDDSQFSTQAPACGGNEELMKAAWTGCHPLQPEVDPTKEKSYDELKKIFDKVMGSGAARNLDTRSQVTQNAEKPAEAKSQDASSPSAQQEALMSSESKPADQPQTEAASSTEEQGALDLDATAPAEAQTATASSVDEDLEFFDGLLDDKK